MKKITGTAVFYCTGRKDHQDTPGLVWVYSGAWPVRDEDWPPYGRKTEMDLNCPVCPRSPRPGAALLRELVNKVAASPGLMFDISYLDM